MTSTVERPTVEVERIPMARVYALILAETRRAHLREPIGIHQNGPGSGVLVVDFNSIGHMASWCGFFGAPPPSPQKRREAPGVFDILRARWQGWAVQLSGSDPGDTAVLDPATAALIDEVTAEPCCNTRKLGAVTEHEKDCAYVATLRTSVDHIHIGDGKFACGAKTGFSSDDPSRADCSDCRNGVRRLLDVLANEPTTTCGDCGGEMTHRAGCPAGDTGGICMYCPTVAALTLGGRISEHETADANGTPCAGSGEWPATDWNDEAIPTGTRAELAAWLAARWPECVDCAMPGGSHMESCAFAAQVRREVASLFDPAAAAAIPVFIVDSASEASLRFVDDPRPPGDEHPLPPDVTPNPAPDDTIERLFDDDARLAVDELNDLPAVSVTQLAKVAATVEPDVPIEYVAAGPDEVLTDEQRHCHTIDVVTVDPELTDDGRGDPGMAHLMAVPVEPPLPPQVLFAQAAERLADVDVARIGVPIDLTAGSAS